MKIGLYFISSDMNKCLNYTMEVIVMKGIEIKSNLISAYTLFGLGLLYVITLTLGLLSLNSPTDPIGNPYVSIMEIIILLMAPMLIILTVSIYLKNQNENRFTNLLAVVFMIIACCITSSVHIVVLSISNHAGANAYPWFEQLFAWKWPSVVYALDILAWDLFFGLSILCLIPNYYKKNRIISMLLFWSGILSIFGLVGPVISNMQFRLIGVFGYAVVFPIACLAIGKNGVKAERPVLDEAR